MNPALQEQIERIAAKLDGRESLSDRVLRIAQRLDSPCGKGWVGTKPPGCKRAGKAGAGTSGGSAPEPKPEPKAKATRARTKKAVEAKPDPKPAPETKARGRAKKAEEPAIATKPELEKKGKKESGKGGPQSDDFQSEVKPITKTVDDFDGTVSHSQDIVTTGKKGEKIRTTIVNPAVTGKAYDTTNQMFEATGGGKSAEAVLGLAANANRVVQVHKLEQESGKASKEQQVAGFKHAIESHAKEGDLVVMHTRQVKAQTDAAVKKHPISSVMTQPFPGAKVLVGKVENGKLRALTDGEIENGKLGEEVRRVRNLQFKHGVSNAEGVKAGYGGRSLQEIYEKEDKIADVVGKTEDKWLGRKPTPGAVKGETYYKERASKWAKEQGFNDDGVNGFTAEATKAHDIGHPATHDALGMGSKEIHKAFGGVKQKNGKPSLLGEEAIVNVMEHLSRGDSLESSIISGIRVARVLSRSAEHETDEGRAAVRSDEFRRTLTDMAEKLYRNDNFNQYSALVRKANRVSGTVTMAGNDFSQTASGG